MGKRGGLLLALLGGEARRDDRMPREELRDEFDRLDLIGKDEQSGVEVSSTAATAAATRADSCTAAATRSDMCTAAATVCVDAFEKSKQPPRLLVLGTDPDRLAHAPWDLR